MRVYFSILTATVALFFSLGSAQAAYPEKPIQFLIGWAAGGGTDTGARMLCSTAEQFMKQPFVIQNVLGGSGAKAYMAIAAAKPDGYTIGCTTSTIAVLKPMGTIPYDHEEFEPIIAFNQDPIMVWVNAEAPWKTLKEFVEYAKTKPGIASTAASNPGSITRFQMMALENASGAEFRVLSDKGGSSGGVVTLAGGHVDSAFAAPLEGYAMWKAGKVRALGVGADQRLPTYPDVPTFKEAGYNVALSSTRMIIAPKGTPKEVIDYLYGVFKKAVEDPGYQTKLKNSGTDSFIYWAPKRCREEMIKERAEFEIILKKAGLFKR